MAFSPYCISCGAANPPQALFCNACGQSLQATASSATGLLAPGSLLKQRYQLVSQVGKGGFGAVYKAKDTQLDDRLVAVKEMRQSGLSLQELKEATQAFQREANLLAHLKHPNLPTIFDHFNEGGRWYLVMEFIEGETLEDRLSRAPGGRLLVDEAIQLGLQLCEVLDYLHSHQPPIIFRDLKPSNIMLGAKGAVYLIDFGIARLFKSGQAKDTTAFGSPGYAAPEQYGKAQTTVQSDIYGLGAVLHQSLSGNDPSHKPFFFAPLHLTSPAGLETLIMQMVKQPMDERPPSVAVVRQELQRISNGNAIHPPPPPPPKPPTPSLSKQGWFRAFAVGVLVAVIVVGSLIGLNLASNGVKSKQNTGASNTAKPTATATPLPAGIITEFPPISGGAPFEITAGPDGNLWFTNFDGQIGRITPMGQITEFPLLTNNTSPADITLGPDGNLWFTEFFGGIGRITPVGKSTQFPLPTGDESRNGITAGPDGNLWFTACVADAQGYCNGLGKIGRITPTGKITEFPLLAGGHPVRIAAGPDGNLWFTEDSYKIGRITPTGQITEFPLPTPDGVVDGITAGPDGNLWFIDCDFGSQTSGCYKIGRITPTGKITEFPLPTAGYLEEITAGPDGNLWFPDRDANQVGRITSSGTITEFPLPPPRRAPIGITAGPDGNLWFTEIGSNQIGRITTGR